MFLSEWKRWDLSDNTRKRLEKKEQAVGFLLTKADTDEFTEELEYASIL